MQMTIKPLDKETVMAAIEDEIKTPSGATFLDVLQETFVSASVSFQITVLFCLNGDDLRALKIQRSAYSREADYRRY